MDFDFTEEQGMLRDSLAKYAAGQFDYDKRKAILASPEGWSREIWSALAELGLMAAPLPEAYGGLGGGAIDVLVVMEEFGKALMTEPFVPTVVMSAAALVDAGSEAQKQEYLPAIAAGEKLMAFAYAEPKGRYNPFALATTAAKQSAGFTLNGHKAVVVGGPQADAFVVTARTAGGQRERNGVSLFVVPKSARGVSTRDYGLVDGRRASEVYFENVALGAEHLVGPADGAAALIEKTLDRGAVATCAEAVGVLRMINSLTLEYSKGRKQFGVAIGSFQVMQHRMADMFMAQEQAVSMATMASIQIDTPEGARAASAAKTQISRACRFIGQASIQIHGGMGMSDEMRVGQYFKRATAIENEFGDADYHVKRFITLGKAA